MDGVKLGSCRSLMARIVRLDGVAPAIGEDVHLTASTVRSGDGSFVA